MSNKRQTRSTLTIQATNVHKLDFAAPITRPSRPEVEQLYAGYLGCVPAHLRSSFAVRSMVLELAEAAVACERAGHVLAEEGEYFTDARGNIKSHPATAIRHQATLRMALLISRLGIAPQMDRRELQRAAVFESDMRGGVPLQPPGQAAEGDAPDWAAMVKGN